MSFSLIRRLLLSIIDSINIIRCPRCTFINYNCPIWCEYDVNVDNSDENVQMKKCLKIDITFRS